MAERFVTYMTEDAEAGKVPVNGDGVLDPAKCGGGVLYVVLSDELPNGEFHVNVDCDTIKQHVFSNAPIVVSYIEHNNETNARVWPCYIDLGNSAYSNVIFYKYNGVRLVDLCPDGSFSTEAPV